MTDPTPEPTPEPTPDPAPEPDPTPTPAPDTDAEVKKWKELARKHEERAKANAAAAKELETVKAASMSEQEKAVAEAKAAGRTEALTEAGAKVAKAEFKAAAKGRLDDDGLAALLEGLDLKAFLDESGDVDAEKIAAFVDRIAPEATEEEAPVGDLLAGLDLGQGKRTTTAGLGTTQFQRDLETSLGIR